MTKIDKIDLENIKNLQKELKDNNLSGIKIKKGTYELEVFSKTYTEKINQEKQKDLNIDQSKNTVALKEKEKINKENVVLSPMVGVVYLSSDPASPPFIKEGQHVKQGDILLLIEAMKTFNEIKAPKSGVIQKIIILNSQPVEFGDDLVIFE